MDCGQGQASVLAVLNVWGSADESEAVLTLSSFKAALAATCSSSSRWQICN
jgi:hypothetical protein